VSRVTDVDILTMSIIGRSIIFSKTSRLSDLTWARSTKSSLSTWVRLNIVNTRLRIREVTENMRPVLNGPTWRQWHSDQAGPLKFGSFKILAFYQLSNWVGHTKPSKRFVRLKNRPHTIKNHKDKTSLMSYRHAKYPKPL